MIKSLLFIILSIILSSYIYAVPQGFCGAPQFFDYYDQKMIDNVVQIKNAKSVSITYTSLKLKPLAYQIKSELESLKTPSLLVHLNQLDLKDTNTVKYRHDVVVMTVCF